MRPNLYRNSPSPSKGAREEIKGEASTGTAASTNKHAHLAIEPPPISPPATKLKDMEAKDSFYDIVLKSSARRSRANSLGRVSFDPSGGDEDIGKAQWRMSEDNINGGVKCSYYDYTYR